MLKLITYEIYCKLKFLRNGHVIIVNPNKKASLLHIDDVYVLIESCQSFPQILNESLNLFFKQKRKPGPKPGSKFNRRKTKEKVNWKTIFNDKIAIKRSTSLTDISTG